MIKVGQLMKICKEVDGVGVWDTEIPSSGKIDSIRRGELVLIVEKTWAMSRVLTPIGRVG